jgi:transposase
MSQKEVRRLEVVKRVLDGLLGQEATARLLALSVRQVGRLCRRLREQGPPGLVSRKRCRPSNRRIAPERRASFVELVQRAKRRRARRVHSPRPLQDVLANWCTSTAAITAGSHCTHGAAGNSRLLRAISQASCCSPGANDDCSGIRCLANWAQPCGQNHAYMGSAEVPPAVPAGGCQRAASKPRGFGARQWHAAPARVCTRAAVLRVLHRGRAWMLATAHLDSRKTARHPTHPCDGRRAPGASHW